MQGHLFQKQSWLMESEADEACAQVTHPAHFHTGIIQPWLGLTSAILNLDLVSLIYFSLFALN